MVINATFTRIEQLGKSRLIACTYDVGYPHDNPVQVLSIPPLRQPASAVITMQAHQPDSGDGHPDQWLLKSISRSSTELKIMITRTPGDYGSVRIDILVFDPA